MSVNTAMPEDQAIDPPADRQALRAMVRDRLPHPWIRDRYADIALRNANGETYASIAASEGVSKARIGQIFQKTKRVLLKYGRPNKLHQALARVVRRGHALQLLHAAGVYDIESLARTVAAGELPQVLNTDRSSSDYDPNGPSMHQAQRALEEYLQRHRSAPDCISGPPARRSCNGDVISSGTTRRLNGDEPDVRIGTQYLRTP